MRLGPSKSYLCLIPPPPTLPPPSPDDSQAAVTPSHSWSLLQPLSGTCLYVAVHPLCPQFPPVSSSPPNSIAKLGLRILIATTSTSGNSGSYLPHIRIRPVPRNSYIEIKFGVSLTIFFQGPASSRRIPRCAGTLVGISVFIVFRLLVGIIHPRKIAYVTQRGWRTGRKRRASSA